MTLKELNTTTVCISLIADYKRLDSDHLVPEAVNASIAMYRSTSEG